MFLGAAVMYRENLSGFRVHYCDMRHKHSICVVSDDNDGAEDIEQR